LVVVSNLRPLKRIGDTIRALHRLHDAHPLAYLVIVGEDRADGGRSHREELAQLAASLGIAHHVRFAGKVPDPMPIIEAADVCLLTSETEGLSNAVVEYMVAGKPVVCSRVGGNVELIEHDRNGFVVEVGDVAAISQAVNDLLERDALREKFGQSSRERARRLFDPAGMVARHQALYEETAGVHA
jgi:glycosyltransferase involved in cell wall biosynthesis